MVEATIFSRRQRLKGRADVDSNDISEQVKLCVGGRTCINVRRWRLPHRSVVHHPSPGSGGVTTLVVARQRRLDHRHVSHHRPRTSPAASLPLHQSSSVSGGIGIVSAVFGHRRRLRRSRVSLSLRRQHQPIRLRHRQPPIA